jgi:hypothetical protein
MDLKCKLEKQKELIEMELAGDTGSDALWGRQQCGR